MAAVGDLVQVHEDGYGIIGAWEGLFFRTCEEVFADGLTYGDRFPDDDIFLVLERARTRKRRYQSKRNVTHAIRVLNIRLNQEWWTNPGNMVVLTRAQGRKK